MWQVSQKMWKNLIMKEMPKPKDEKRIEPSIYDNPLQAHGPSAVQQRRLTPPERVNAMLALTNAF
jgi:hypothetical protein